MNSYVVIPAIALGCYAVLLLAFIGSKKNKISKSFALLVSLFILWNLGSVLLRLQAPPSVKFWFYFSLSGLFLLPVGISYFIVTYTEYKKKLGMYIVSFCSIAIIAIDIIFDGLFIREPNVVIVNGEPTFSYYFPPLIVIPFTIFSICLAYLISLLITTGRKGIIPKRANVFFISGLAILLLGNILVAVPIFASFPIDMLAGLLTGLLLFGAVMQNPQFSLKLKISKRFFRVVTIEILLMILFEFTAWAQKVISATEITWLKENGPTLTLIAPFIIAALFYFGAETFIDTSFLQQDEIQAQKMKDFTDTVSRSLNFSSIYEIIGNYIKANMPGFNVDFFAYSEDSDLYISDNTESGVPNEVIPEKKWLNDFFTQHNSSISVVVLKHSEGVPDKLTHWMTGTLDDSEILLVPIRSETKVSLLMKITPAGRRSTLTRANVSFLESIAAVSGVAVQNALMYEQIFKESRTDSLTGIGNRKAFFDAMEHAGAYIYPQSLIVVRMDDFQIVNRLYGYNASDDILKKEAELIHSIIDNLGEVYRYNSTEYAVILNSTKVEVAHLLAEKIRKKTMEIAISEGVSRASENQMMITVSCGISSRNSDEISIETLVNNALSAVRQAKANGKNCSIVYREGSTSDAVPLSSFSEYEATLRALLAAIDAKDHYTFNHSQNVSYYATELARALDLDSSSIETIREAGLLHDIGKIGIPESILQKPGKLTDEEFEIMKSHVEQTLAIVRHLPALENTLPAVSGHHEHYDGTGYPLGLAGENIPLLARILCIADSFDAMMSRRSYKDKFTVEYSLNQLHECSGTQFDPKLAAKFIELVEKEQIHIIYTSPR